MRCLLRWTGLLEATGRPKSLGATESLRANSPNGAEPRVAQCTALRLPLPPAARHHPATAGGRRSGAQESIPGVPAAQSSLSPSREQPTPRNHPRAVVSGGEMRM